MIETFIKNKDIEGIKSYMIKNNLYIKDGKILPRNIEEMEKNIIFYEQRNYAKKILLNALYGALLNNHCKYHDERMGQSTTLSGRSITKHMNAKINEIITGKYIVNGDAVIAVDTDSSYFTCNSMKNNPEYSDFEWSRENIVALYKEIETIVNDSFPDFMLQQFNTSLERGALIKAGLELIASKALFVKKKKYAALQYYKDGKRLDIDNSPGKLKVMGLDLKRADTPKLMQNFLESLLFNLLSGTDQKELFDQIKIFRNDFKKLDGWEKGSPKKVNALSDYVSRRAIKMELFSEAKQTKADKIAHIEAAYNWNRLCETYGDRYSLRIGDGSKVVVCKLKKNLMKMTAVAYPIDEPHIPKWFKELPFDHNEMEKTVIDMKLENLIGVLKWDLEKTKDKPGDDFFVF